MATISFRLKRDMPLWKRLKCTQKVQQIWWQTMATPHTGLRVLARYLQYHVRVRVLNNDMRCLSFYILMYLWYGRIASWYIRVLVAFAPYLVPCHRDAALLPCYIPYWLIPSKYVFVGIISRGSVYLRWGMGDGVGSVVSSSSELTARTLRQFWCTTHTGQPFMGNTQIVGGQ